MKDRTRNAAILAWMAVLALAMLLAAPFVGASDIPLSAVLQLGSQEGPGQVFWMLRVPRVLVAFIGGTGLAVAGLTFQSMFRNPLATPFTLGVSSGASFGATLAVKLGLAGTALLGLSAVSLSAFVGALLCLSLVYGLTRLRRGFSTSTMLLAGVAVGFLFSSLILFIQYLSDFAETFRMIRWLMGGLDVVGFEAVLRLAVFVLAGLVVVLLHADELNLLATGEDLAAARGVEVSRTKKVLFFATSLMVGGVVAVCGPIGFVGMMSPHICRLLVGPDHRRLAPVTLLFGGAFLLACDTLARTVIAPAEIPVGVITALLGGPFFLWLLVRGASEKAVV